MVRSMRPFTWRTTVGQDVPASFSVCRKIKDIHIRLTYLGDKTSSSMETWLTSLITKTPQEGFELAIKLSRMGVKYTQPSAEVRDKLRPAYAENADSLTMASHVVAVNFQTVAAANGYWR